MARRVFGLSVVLLLSVASYLPAEEKPFLIQAHRGAGIAQPENTLEAFEYSWNLGVTPEADLRTTSDGVIVCFHDSNLKRVVGNIAGEKKQDAVEKLPASEVTQLEVGSFRGEQFRGQKVPTLEAVFAAMKGRPERLLYLDIKTADQQQLINLIRQYDVTPQVIYTTKHHHLIRQWKELVPQSQTLMWNGGSEEELSQKLANAREANFKGITQLQIHVRVGDLESEDPFTPSVAFLRKVGDELKSRGILFQTLPWECSDQQAYEKLLQLGVESFATDYPEVTVAAVKSMQKN